MVDVYLYQGHASPTDVVLRDVVPDAAAALSVYLYQGHASPSDVVLRELTLTTVTVTGTATLTTDDVTLAAAGTVSAGGSVTGTAAITCADVTSEAIGQVIGTFTIAADYQRPGVLQPIPQRFVVAPARAAWWRKSA